MHEVGIMQSALDTALDRAARAKAVRIHSIRLRVGEISGVCADSLEFAFDVLRRGTAAESARLVVETVPMQLGCARCGGPVEVGLQSCTACGSRDLAAIHGLELELAAVEVSSP